MTLSYRKSPVEGTNCLLGAAAVAILIVNHLFHLESQTVQGHALAVFFTLCGLWLGVTGARLSTGRQPAIWSDGRALRSDFGFRRVPLSEIRSVEVIKARTVLDQPVGLSVTLASGEVETYLNSLWTTPLDQVRDALLALVGPTAAQAGRATPSGAPGSPGP